MCLNSSSSSSSSSDVFDERVGADNGAVAFRASNATVNFDSEEIASLAINSNKSVLETSVDFIGKTFTEVLNQADKRAAASEAQAIKTQEFARGIVEDSSETADDRLISIVKYGGILAIAAIAIQSGAIKEITGAFK